MVGGISLGTGAAYLAAFGAEVWPLLPAAAIAAVRQPPARAAAAFAALLSAYVWGIGGDAFGHSRFLLPALAVLAALCVRGVASLLESAPRRGAWLAAAIPAAIAWQLLYPAGWRDARSARADTRRHNEMPDDWHRMRAHRLLERRPPPELVAAQAIGRLGYYSGLPILDLFGLTDPNVSRSRESVEGWDPLPGHQRSNAAYVLARRPDYVLIPKRGSLDARDAAPAVVALWNSDALEALYEWDAPLQGYRLRVPPPHSGSAPAASFQRASRPSSSARARE
jgi:hypothetical protein